MKRLRRQVFHVEEVVQQAGSDPTVGDHSGQAGRAGKKCLKSRPRMPGMTVRWEHEVPVLRGSGVPGHDNCHQSRVLIRP
jgi:hypothetical protein